MKKILNYIKVSKSISTSGQPTKKEFKKIKNAGFDVVINLAMHNKGALPKEDKIVSKLGMIYIHIPITWKAPELDKILLALQILYKLQQNDKKVFIHCIKNYRASVLIYLYKRDFLKQKDTKLIAPKDFKPNRVWKKVMKSKVKI